MKSSKAEGVKRYGVQAPTFSLEPERAYTDGPDAAELVEAYGYKLDPWQRTIMDAWLGRDENDKFTARSCGLSVARQQGKNALLEVRELYGIVCTGEKFLHTAHEVKTARKAFERLASFFSNPSMYPELAEMVATIRRTNGQEAIVLTNGGSVEFSARSRGAARGFTVDTVVFDEAQELTDEQTEAILPTLAAAPSGNRQFIYTGTPPGPNSPGEVFKRTRDNAHKHLSTSLAWHEWAVDEVGDVDDRDRWYRTNPALGYRITEDFCNEERLAMTPDGFARERLGWWSTQSAAAAIPSWLWEAGAISRAEIPQHGCRAFGVKFSPDGSLVACSVCVIPEGEPAYVECIATGSIADGIDWLASIIATEEAEEVTAAVAVDGRNGTAALIDRLREVYPRQAIMVPGPRGMVDAASMFDQALRSHTLTHWASEDGQQAALDKVAHDAVKRPVGNDGGWAYGGDDSALIESCTLAYYAAKTTNRDPEGGCVVL